MRTEPEVSILISAFEQLLYTIPAVARTARFFSTRNTIVLPQVRICPPAKGEGIVSASLTMTFRQRRLFAVETFSF